MSFAVNAFVHAICKCSRMTLVQKVVHFPLRLIPMIQLPLDSTCVALQYEPGTKFFHGVVPKICGIQNQVYSVQPRGLSLCLLQIMKNAKQTGIVFKVLGQGHHHPEGLGSLHSAR